MLRDCKELSTSTDGSHPYCLNLTQEGLRFSTETRHIFIIDTLCLLKFPSLLELLTIRGQYTDIVHRCL